jgi:flagellum-specific ATP synthase
MLPRLVERSGTGPNGSITGIYTVLVEGDDNNEPISDTLRGLLDGHFVLSRRIAHRGRYPAIDILGSLSRLQNHLVDRPHIQATVNLRNLISTYRDNEDLISIGAYQRGSNLLIDRAIALQPQIDQFLAQDAREIAGWDQTVVALKQLTAPATGAPTPQPHGEAKPATIPAVGQQPAARAQPAAVIRDAATGNTTQP